MPIYSYQVQVWDGGGWGNFGNTCSSREYANHLFMLARLENLRDNVRMIQIHCETGEEKVIK